MVEIILVVLVGLIGVALSSKTVGRSFKIPKGF